MPYSRSNPKYKLPRGRPETRLAWKRANRERLAGYSRKWRAAHPDQRKLVASASQKRHPETHALSQTRRRARKASAEGSHTNQEWIAKCEEFGMCCYWCGKSGTLTRDHVVPLSKGGSDYISNIVPACRSCNSGKGDRPAELFRLKRAV